LNHFERPSHAYSDPLRTVFERLCSHSPYNPLSVRRRSNPSLGLGGTPTEPTEPQRVDPDIFLGCSLAPLIPTERRIHNPKLQDEKHNCLNVSCFVDLAG
jgi:hypothetical protein